MAVERGAEMESVDAGRRQKLFASARPNGKPAVTREHPPPRHLCSDSLRFNDVIDTYRQRDAANFRLEEITSSRMAIAFQQYHGDRMMFVPLFDICLAQAA